MPKNRAFLFYASALLAVSPALLLYAPGLAARLEPIGSWQLGLDLGLLVWALLAWRLNQNRLTVLAGGLLVASHWIVGATLAGQGKSAVEGWLLALPAGLGLSLLPREGVLLSERTMGRLALLLLPAGLAWSVASANPMEARQLLDWRIVGPTGNGLSHLAHAGLLVFTGCLMMRWHPKVEAVLLTLGGGLLGQVLLAWTLDVAVPDAGLGARIWLASCLLLGLAISVGLFFLYWQRVYLDELTNIPNRRALDERLAHLDGVWALAMVDIDHFKNFNDSYGHDQGDDVLRLVARHLSEGTGGRAYRYGGEEFCVLCPGEDSAQVETLMDEVREGLARRRFHIRLPKGIRRKTGPGDRGSLAAPTTQVQVTVSVGVAKPDKRRREAPQVMKLADEGLYDAKERGRNQVVRKN